MPKRKNSERDARFKHGKWRTPEFEAWCAMKKRCYGNSPHMVRLYKDRGVTVCKRWLDSFLDFLADVGPRPSSEHCLDRFPNQDGNYEPDNVRWATITEQNRNKRNNRFITHDNKTLMLIEWAELLGMKHGTISARLRMGWSVEKTLTTPVIFWPRNRVKQNLTTDSAKSV